MNKTRITFLSIFMALFLSLFTIDEINAIDNFEINDLEVNVFVNKDGSYDIEEIYEMNFIAPGLGFYRDIPSYYSMNFSDENSTYKRRYYFPISNIELEGDVYYIENSINGKQLVIGPDDGPRFTGIRDYKISYKLQTQSLDLPSQKEAFFFNLVSGWRAPIHNFKANVEFESPVDTSNLIVRFTNSSQEFDLDCSNLANGFSCAYDQSFVLGEGYGITANLALADDFFTRANNNFSYAFLIIMALALLGLSIALKTLKVPSIPLVKKVMFTAPKGFNGPMLAKEYKSFITIPDAQAILFEWASKGYILIDERKDGLYFKKLSDNLSGNNSELKLFNALFKDNEFVSLKQWSKQGVYEDFMAFINALGIEVKKIVTMYDKKSLILQGLLAIITIVIIYLANTLILNKTLMSFGSASLLALLYSFVIMLPVLFGILLLSQAKKNGISRYNFIFVILSAIVTFLLAIFMARLNIYGIRIEEISYGILMALLVCNLAYASLISRRTQAGSDVYGEILGLRDFIKYAKVDELKAMQEINPSLYYDVLPYAYAFGMSDLWSNHFKTIEIPASNYYRSYNPSLTNYLIMRNMMRSMNKSASSFTPPAQKSGRGGGSFSSGGGFSGGFSGGGGFGGGGGGGR